MRKGSSAPVAALLESREDGRLALRAPGVGLWREAPEPGTPLAPGASIGALEVLGVRQPLVAPQGARGVVFESHTAGAARRPVGHGQLLLVLSPVAADAAVAPDEEAPAAAGLVFVAPMSGRFYLRPGPDKAPFLTVGDTIELGQTVCLLEVMKTFNRVQYEGPGLPREARIGAIVPADGDDLNRGDPILELER